MSEFILEDAAAHEETKEQLHFLGLDKETGLGGFFADFEELEVEEEVAFLGQANPIGAADGHLGERELTLMRSCFSM